MNFGLQMASNWKWVFNHPPSVNSAFHFIARLRRRRSANGTTPNFAKRWTEIALTICRRKVGVIPSEKNWGPKNFCTCSVFPRLRGLMANICRNKRHIDNQARASEIVKGFLHCPKILSTLVHKRLKTGPAFYPPSLFRFVPVHRTPSVRRYFKAVYQW